MTTESTSNALQVIREQLDAATAARKCHTCGCFAGTVEALAASSLATDLAQTITRARAFIAARKYDCLGCPICYPAIAANAFAADNPVEGATLDLCPTDAPIERRGWPPLPGDYRVVRYRAPIAVCTLNDEELVERLAGEDPQGLALVGTMRTENLGIERLIRNVLANPHIRFLVLCGDDTQQAVGHLPGQSLASLFEHGLDVRGRIRGARGKRPTLPNVTADQVRDFVEQVELANLIGTNDMGALTKHMSALRMRDPGPFERSTDAGGVAAIQAKEPRRLVPDPAGFLVVYPDALRCVLVVEHYTTHGVLDCIIEGRTPAAVSSEAIERGLLTRLDHAAYLGRELAVAERSMRTGERYVQDRAPGELVEEAAAEPGCGCATVTACGETK